MEKKVSAEKAVREIRRKTRRRFSAEEKIRIVIEGLRGDRSPLKQGPYRAVGPSLVQLNVALCRSLQGRERNPPLFLALP
jgi:hypothetical protein